MSNGGEKYVSVTGAMLAKTEKAVRIQTEATEDPTWIPRSCIHGADDRRIDATAKGDEITLRIFEWKARAEGLI